MLELYIKVQLRRKSIVKSETFLTITLQYQTDTTWYKQNISCWPHNNMGDFRSCKQ